jgi:hypothetical protein
MTVQTPQKLGPYEAGDAVEFEVDVTHEDGTVADLTSMTPHVFLARADEPSNVVASSEAPLSNITVQILAPATEGVVNVKMKSADTLALRGTYAWRVAVKDVLNQKDLVARGYVDFIEKIGP